MTSTSCITAGAAGCDGAAAATPACELEGGGGSGPSPCSSPAGVASCVVPTLTPSAAAQKPRVAAHSLEGYCRG